MDRVLKSNFLITSRPGTGKTTLIRKIAGRLLEAGLDVGGFYTEEIRQDGERVGFRVVTLDGAVGTLAEIGNDEPRVGKYSVNVPEFEAVGVAALELAITQADIIILDEIGKMELLSPGFRDAVPRVLEADKPLVGTVGHAEDPLISAIKKRPDVELIELTRANRDKLINPILERLRIN